MIMDKNLKSLVKMKNGILDKRKGVYKVNPLDALKRVMDTSRVLLPKECITYEMEEFLSQSKRKKHFIPTIEQKDFFWNKKFLLSHSSLEGIDTRYVEVSVRSLAMYYGNAICNEWRMKNYNTVNFKRMTGAEHLEFDRWIDIIDICSYGIWELMFMENKGCYIHINFEMIGKDNPMEIIKTNQLICANMSHIIGNNAKYYRSDRISAPTEDEYYQNQGYEAE